MYNNTIIQKKFVYLLSPIVFAEKLLRGELWKYSIFGEWFPQLIFPAVTY